MTAREIATKIVRDSLRKNYDLSIPEIEATLEAWKSDWCKKQRLSCANTFIDNEKDTPQQPLYNKILTAPEPD